MTFRVGNATITKLPELFLEGVHPTAILPTADAEQARQATLALGDDAVDHITCTIMQSTHAWLMRVGNRVILLDTATGNDKNIPMIPVLDHLSEPFLERLRQTGVSPDDVTDVLITHVHADHVGWNTYLDKGEWRPTFRYANHYFSGREIDYNQALANGETHNLERLLAEAALGAPLHPPASGVFEASVYPVIAAGLSKSIAVDRPGPIPGFSYLGTPGHSIDHASIMFEDAGEKAFFWGDVLHHPVQLANLDWNSIFCEFPEAARAARRKALNIAAETGALVFTTHFPASSAGRIRHEGNSYRWLPEKGDV